MLKMLTNQFREIFEYKIPLWQTVAFVLPLLFVCRSYWSNKGIKDFVPSNSESQTKDSSRNKSNDTEKVGQKEPVSSEEEDEEEDLFDTDSYKIEDNYMYSQGIQRNTEC